MPGSVASEATRSQMVEAAIAHLNRAALSDTPLWDATLGLKYLLAAILLQGNHLQQEVADAVAASSKAAAEAVAPQCATRITPEQLYWGFGACARTFRLSCCRSDDERPVTDEEAGELAATLLWLHVELEAAHRRAALGATGQRLLRLASVHFAFEDAAPRTPAH